MIKKNINKGFSLVELLIVLGIAMILSVTLAMSYMNLTKEAKMDKDMVKFESICSAFKSALGEPEVIREMEEVGGGGDMKVVCQIGAEGEIVFANGRLIGVSTGKTENLVTSDLWLNTYQSVGTKYTAESNLFRNQYLIFTLTPKTASTTAKCKYEVCETQ